MKSHLDICRTLLMLLEGADIQFRRPNRLDVCMVQNHPIALYVFQIFRALTEMLISHIFGCVRASIFPKIASFYLRLTYPLSSA